MILLLGHTHGLAIIGILLSHIVLDCSGEVRLLSHGLLRRVAEGWELANTIRLSVLVGRDLGGFLIEELMLLLGIGLCGRLVLMGKLFRLEVGAGSALTLIAHQSGHWWLISRLGLWLLYTALLVAHVVD
jgi:hypothetical protein